MDRTFYEGVYTTPGLSTNIIIEKVSTSRLPIPFSECTLNLTSVDSYSSDLYKMIMEKIGTYKKITCNKLCLQKEIEEKCNCSDNTTPISYYDNKPACLDIYQLSCTLKLYTEFLSKAHAASCDCPTECDEVSFPYTVSVAPYPSPNYANILLKNPSILSKFLENESVTIRDLKEKLVSVNIFYNEIKETVVTESPSVQFSDLMAQIGGVLGLFLGMSFLSFVEFLEIFIKIIFVLTKKDKIQNSY